MPRCLDWETAASIPWGIIMLLGCVHAYHRRIKTFLSPVGRAGGARGRLAAPHFTRRCW
jgi:hypothetical protein